MIAHEDPAVYLSDLNRAFRVVKQALGEKFQGPKIILDVGAGVGRKAIPMKEFFSEPDITLLE